MKFTSIVVLATGALAAKPVFMEPSLVKRQSISQVESDVTAISSAAAALDASIKSFSGASDSQALIAASGTVVTAINKAQSDSAGFPDNSLTLNQALPLAGPIGDLGTIVKTAVTDLIAKKSQFASLNLCGQVLTQVQNQQKAANSFQTTLIGKLDSSAKSTGQQLAAPLIDSLNQAATAFASCPAGSSSSGSSSTSSSGVTSTGVSTTAVTSSTATGSFVSTTCTTTGTSVPVTNGTIPTTTPKPTVVPNANAGVQTVAGFGGIIAAALLAVAAF